MGRIYIYPKLNTFSDACYGCNNTGIVLSRGKEYECPICKGNSYIPKDVMVIDGYNEAITDIVEVKNGKVAVYDANKIIEILIDQGLSEEEAVEYFDYNIYNAKLGDNQPMFKNVI